MKDNFTISTVTITKLYDLLSSKVGKETAEELTQYIEQKIKSDLTDKTTSLATKEALSETKAELIKWMFLFWIGQLAATFGFILLFLKK